MASTSETIANASIAPDVHEQPPPSSPDPLLPGSAEPQVGDQHVKQMQIDEDPIPPNNVMSPISADGEKQDDSELLALNGTDHCSPSMGYDFSNIRVSLAFYSVVICPSLY
jgi:hypothetical protein